MKDKTTVAVILNGASLQCDASRKTTCDDIIKMVIEKSPNGTEGFAVFETAFGVEKMLPGKTKLLKLIRSWGADKHNFHLEVKEAGTVKSKMASIKRAVEKLKRLRSLIMKHEMKACEKFGDYLTDNLVSNASNKDNYVYNKNISVIDKTAFDKVQGKDELLQRHLNDSVENNITTVDRFNDIKAPVRRTSGVGRENNSVFEPALLERTCGDGKEDVDYLVSHDEQSLNKAFVINETTIYDNGNDNLNDCILFDSEDTISEDESAFEDDSDYDSICELERNVIGDFDENTFANIYELKNMFSNCDLNARISEDELLESFMNTFVNDEESDEGMGSVHSDYT